MYEFKLTREHSTDISQTNDSDANEETINQTTKTTALNHQGHFPLKHSVDEQCQRGSYQRATLFLRVASIVNIAETMHAQCTLQSTLPQLYVQYLYIAAGGSCLVVTWCGGGEGMKGYHFPLSLLVREQQCRYSMDLFPLLHDLLKALCVGRLNKELNPAFSGRFRFVALKIQLWSSAFALANNYCSMLSHNLKYSP